MPRSLFWFCSVALLLHLGCGRIALAQKRVPAHPAAKPRDFAMLMLTLNSSPTARLTFSWMSTEPMPEVGEVRQALQDCLGGSTEIIEPVSDFHLSFRNRGAFERHGLVARGGMELAPLMKLLRDRGITRLSLQVIHPHTGFYDSTPYHDDPTEREIPWRASEQRLRRSLRKAGVLSAENRFPDMSQYEFLVQDPAPRFEVEFGYGSETLLPLAALLILILLPPLGTLWLRRRALRASGHDPAAALFSFDRTVGWLCLGALFGWIVAVSIFHVDERLVEIYQFLRGRPYLGSVIPNPFGIWPISLILVPNACVVLWCLALSYPLSKRLRDVEWSRGQMIARAFWQQAGMVLPVLFLCCALGAFVVRDFRVMVLWLIAGYISRVLGVRLGMGSARAKLIPLDVGPLRDRIFELAKKAGIAIRQVYLMPASKDRHANAFAVQGNKMILNDYLVRNLSRREVDAIVAHELAHLKYRHPGKLGWSAKTVIFLFAALFIVADIAPSWFAAAFARRAWLAEALYFVQDSRVFVWAVFMLLLMAALRLRQRGWELLADREAAALTGDARATITALVKIGRLNLQPMEWGKWQGRLLTHPSHSRRLLSLAEHGGLSREDLVELVKLPDDGSGMYDVPRLDAAEERLYSPAFKQRRALIISWLRLLTLAAPPALVALAVQKIDGRDPMCLLTLAGGFLATFTIYTWVNSRLSVWGEAPLCRRWREKQEKEQLQPDDLGALCVAFSPGPTIKLYEQSYDWDMGCLYLTSGLLCYVGEQTRFALRPEQIVGIRLQAGPPRWTKSRRVFVTWCDAENGREGTFSLRPFGVRSLHQLNREMVLLHDRLQAWLRDPAPFPAPSKPLLQLPASMLGEVTGTALREAKLARTLLRSLMLVGLVAVGVSLLLGFFSDWQGSFRGLYVVGASTLIWVLFFLPTWWRGWSSRRENTPAPTSTDRDTKK